MISIIRNTDVQLNFRVAIDSGDNQLESPKHLQPADRARIKIGNQYESDLVRIDELTLDPGTGTLAFVIDRGYTATWELGNHPLYIKVYTQGEFIEDKIGTVTVRPSLHN